MGSERCLTCECALVFASEREMLLWAMVDSPKGDAIAMICPECEHYYCVRCMNKTGKSCPTCGATVYNAGIR